MRKVEAETAQKEAERIKQEAAGKHPVVHQLATENVEFGVNLAQITEYLERITLTRQAVASQHDLVEQEYKNAKQKLEIAGLSDVLGQALRQQRRALPGILNYRKEAIERKKRASEIGFAYLKAEERRRDLRDPKSKLQRLIQSSVDASSVGDRSDLEKQVLGLLQDQRSLVDNLTTTYSKSLQSLADLDFSEQLLIDRINQYASFLDEQLLWSPSAAPLRWDALGALGAAGVWITDPTHWSRFGDDLWTATVGAPIAAGGALVVFLGLVVVRSRLRSRLILCNTRVGMIHADNLWLTVISLGFISLLVAPLPLLMYVISWLLQRLLGGANFSSALGAGLASSSGLAFILLFLRRINQSKGFSEVHLRWREPSTRVLRRNLLWVTPIALACVFLVSMTEWHDDIVLQQGLGRTVFIIGMIAMGIFTQRVLRPNGRVMTQFLQRNPQGWLTRLRWAWYPVAIGTPYLLALIAAVGYYYTALALAQRLLFSSFLVTAVVFAHELAIRWLIVEHRKLALDVVRQKEAAIQAGQTTDASSEEPVETDVVSLNIPDVTLATINIQTRQLLRALTGALSIIGLWLIWSDVLPALKVLNQVQLWSHTAIVGGLEKLIPITLADIGVAVIAVVMTVVAARNLPGFLEILVLRHLSIDSGLRYAITTICRYVLIAVGVIVIFSVVGVGWSKIQWLVAALSVGLGFGLQEIVANFVSGLIILLERPIRLGDTVTIDQISGVVSRIQIRATTVTDWDRKELIVPNKTFITSNLINWTLSDPITRLIVKVGIAYGSDTELAQKVMMNVAESNSAVLPEPKPAVFFLGFGESSLDFEVRVFVKDLTNRGRAAITSELHMAIDKAFRENGIVIAFPQRDVHIHTAESSLKSGTSEQHS